MPEAKFLVTINIDPEATDTLLDKVLAEESDSAACEVFKSVEESRVTVGLAYPHNRPDRGIAKDGFQDFAGRSAVERACWAFTSKSRSVGINHLDGTEGHGEVVESAIHRGPDWVTKSDDGQSKIIKDGDWVIAVRWDPETWQNHIKSGRLKGFSPQGKAKRAIPTSEQLAQLRSD